MGGGFGRGEADMSRADWRSFWIILAAVAAGLALAGVFT